MKKIQDCWKEIRNAGLANDTGILFMEAGIPLNVYAIVEGSSEGIAVVVKPKIPSRIEQFESYGMRFETCEIFGLNGVKILHNSQHRDEFLIFMADLLDSEHYSVSSDPIFCLSKFVEIVLRWKNFFKVIGDKSYFDIKGMFGEMHILSQLLNLGMNQTELLESWQIDHKSRVDFIFSRKQIEIEVKSIEAVTDKNVPISSIEQLTNVGRQQFLAVNKIRTGTGISINELYVSVRERLNEQLRTKLDNLLVEFKLPPKILKNFDSSKFSVVDTIIYNVDNSFPRFTRPTVPEGIVSAKYEIALSSIPLSNHSSMEKIMEHLK